MELIHFINHDDAKREEDNELLLLLLPTYPQKLFSSRDKS